MSLFRKPTKKIQRRVYTADDDDVDGEPEPPPPPIISRMESKPDKKKMTSLLSFADEEEEEVEVFQVKKSSQSKKLAKKREKERRRGPDGDGDNNKYDNNVIEVKPKQDENDKPKKNKVSLEGLILSGREAAAADGAGDVSGDSGGGSGDEDSRGFHRFRPEHVRAALAVAPGHIPDAALIHAARKTRQQARELGDFVPIGSAADKNDGPRSRLVREDGSGDEDEDGRIQVVGLEMPSDKPKRGTCAAPSNEELDSEEGETEAWEHQQLQKAMPAITERGGEGVDVNPFSLRAPPPPALSGCPPHLRPLVAAGEPPPAAAADMLRLLANRLSELKCDREQTAIKSREIRDRLLAAARTRENRAARTSELDSAYRKAQAIRGYLTDLVECLDEKLPALEALEARALALHRRRCEFLVERRRADVRDQAHDVLAAGRPGPKSTEDEAKSRRAAEREGRRRARRLKREAAGTAAGHREGDSSDDELPPAEDVYMKNERAEIAEVATRLFADALPAWRSVRGVCRRLARFRRALPAAYSDAYLPETLPRLLAPYVRKELILWNPLADEDNEDWEKMDWYKCLMMYGVRDDKLAESDDSDDSDDLAEDGHLADVTEDSVRDDPDLMLVPTIVNKVVLPKITEVVEQAWDPMCVRSSVRLRGVVLRAAGGGGRRAAPLAAAAARALAAAAAADLFLPALPPCVIEGPGGSFWRRCLGGGVRLLRSALALTAPPPELRAHRAVMLIIDTLCTAAGAAPGAAAAGAAAALAAALPRSGPLRAAALRRIARLAHTALQRMDSNPLHLKAIEQARSIIAEAKIANDDNKQS